MVLDWNMPGMDGGHVLREMRARNLDIPVIVLSGCAPKEVGGVLAQFGACFLNKDTVDRSGLRRAIAAAMVLGPSWPGMCSHLPAVGGIQK